MLQVVVVIVVYTIVALFLRLKFKIKWIWSFLLAGCATLLIPSSIFGSMPSGDTASTQSTQSTQVVSQDQAHITASNDHNNKEEVTQQPSSGIKTTFQYGASLEEVEQKLGTPVKQEKNFWRYHLVKFKTESYLFDTKNKVAGMLITSPSIPIYDVNLGMNEAEISAHLGKPIESRFDTTESNVHSKIYITTYKHDGNIINFVSQTKNSKNLYAVILQE